MFQFLSFRNPLRREVANIFQLSGEALESFGQLQGPDRVHVLVHVVGLQAVLLRDSVKEHLLVWPHMQFGEFLEKSLIIAAVLEDLVENS